MIEQFVNSLSKIKSTESNNLIERYYKGLQKAFENIDGGNKNNLFEPAFELPQLDEQMIKFFEVAQSSYSYLGDYKDKSIYLLNLMKNPGTNTTKTLASLLMVARAVNHIKKTGERILIFTPSSGNKAIALRDAVERAIKFGLVAKEELRIITLTPKNSSHKLRKSDLSENEELLKLNPMFIYNGEIPQDVKKIGSEFIKKYDRDIETKYGYRVWYSLDIRNYKVADSLRAFFDYEFFPWKENQSKRLHAHAVSSAYGLLGYNYGRTIIKNEGMKIHEPNPGYLLVQHSETSDMVLSLLYNDFSRSNYPKYIYDETDGMFKQKQNSHFPYKTWRVIENLDGTFYTHNPPTSPEMNNLIHTNGGTGIVVSLSECLSRIGIIKQLLKGTDVSFPEDIRDLNEWSLVMAFTGVTNAIDRNLVDAFDDIIIHGSGIYSEDDYLKVEKTQVKEIGNHKEMFHAVFE
ncbi:DUF6002 family protein [Anaerobacillus isosaccharinicus]|uniref:Uncharacterized protein n=1 Tax=Anaerobacillus isosaccharinicus TaxID=1532552 RepID=A0A1S2M003_9BACI|nr:DUF6002 family protein [Anaerobacillus isosaccharinicus]MBA5586655.1 hypothetical protein [Anaerobacillus isosaccharinicus]QOY35112.1 hypothetical protein AWH56_020790 [Anaerobacillus isosaccharinicus]